MNFLFEFFNDIKSKKIWQKSLNSSINELSFSIKIIVGNIVVKVSAETVWYDSWFDTDENSVFVRIPHPDGFTISIFVVDCDPFVIKFDKPAGLDKLWFAKFDDDTAPDGDWFVVLKIKFKNIYFSTV